MSRTSLRDLLNHAAEQRYAVPCINAINLDMARGVIEAAEAERSPVILCHAELHFKYTPLETIAPILVREMNESSVPVCVLLDHGKTFDDVVRAMHDGFNAVMFDGSELPYEENVRQTAQIVKIARALDVGVEGELGYVTRPRSGGAEGNDEDDVADDSSYYTDPEQAADFVARTGVDALAIAFGTAHGIYLKKPKIDFPRLRAIRAAVPVPLVMHGGSGLAQEDFDQSIADGISKINYYTGMAMEVVSRAKAELNESPVNLGYHHLMEKNIKFFREQSVAVMRAFGSSGRAQ